MRVLLTSPYAHPFVWRGAERYVSELADCLARSGHEVTVVASGPEDATSHRSSGALVVHRRLRPLRWNPLRVRDVTRTVWPVARGLVGRGCDVAQCHNYPDGLALHLTGAHPYVFWLPGVPVRSRLGGRVDRVAGSIALRRADRILALSRFAADALAEVLGLSAEVQPPGVDVGLYAGERPLQHTPTILTTAAASDPRKRLPVLVAAFDRLLADEPDARLVLVQPERDAAERLVADLRQSTRDRVELRVGLDPAAIATAYRSATVSVLPSVDEAFGLVQVESLAAGTPVVGSDHGAIPEVIDDGRTGILVPPDDVDALADGLARGIALSSEPATARRCREAAMRWDWSAIGPQHVAHYDAVLAGT